MDRSFYCETERDVRKSFIIELIKKKDDDIMVKLQSKLISIRIPKFYDKNDSYRFENNEILINKPI